VKVGAENRTKLIAAIVAGALALILVATRFSALFGGSSPGLTTSASTRLPSAAELSNAPARSVPKNGSRKRQTGKNASATVSLDPTLHLDLLRASEDRKYAGTGRNIFRVFIEPPPKALQDPALDHRVAGSGPQVPPPPPPPPPSNLRFYGFATSRPDGAKRIFLTKNEDVFIAAEGDIVDRRYKVVRISTNAVEILDVLSNNRESIPLTQG